jgi:hypothetical protein
MVEVTCFQCRTVVRISPDDYECPKCEQDLRQLLGQEHVSGYFYNRASALAANSEFQSALEETERGLTYYGSPELHLLAAILAQKLGRYDQMRHHVAAIPLEDSLRSEAEWLLRAHQDRQKALREGLKVDRNVRKGGIQATQSIVVERMYGEQSAVPPAAVRRAGFLKVLTVASVVIVSLVILVVAAGELFPEETAWLRSIPDFFVRDADTEPVFAGEDGEMAGLDTSGALTVTQATTMTLAPGGVNADGTPRRLTVISAQPFDVTSLLEDAGREELLALEIVVRLDDGEATVEGVVLLDEQRRALESLLTSAPAVQSVNTEGLLLRPLPVYVVQPGDTLWTVVFNIYGDVERLQDVYRANTDILPSADALQPGMELRVPPVD